MTPGWAGAIAVLVAGSLAGTFFYGESVGRDSVLAKQKREAEVRQETIEAAQQGAAAAIAGLKPVYTTIKQEVQREIQTEVRYRDCRHDASSVRNINAALAGKPNAAGGLKLPGAGAAGR